MIKRIPKLVAPVDHSVWAMQELTDVNTKCMRHAALSQPKRHYRVVIRAPVPWHQQFLIAREYATHNLFATHPISLELRKLWDAKYNIIQLLSIYKSFILKGYILTLDLIVKKKHITSSGTAPASCLTVRGTLPNR